MHSCEFKNKCGVNSNVFFFTFPIENKIFKENKADSMDWAIDSYAPVLQIPT